MKHIIIIAGDPGTGKTSVAQSIAQQFRAPLLDKDTLCDPFVHLIGEHFLKEDPKHCDFYDSHLRELEYKILFDVMLENIQSVDTIVLVAPFSREVSVHNDFLWRLENAIYKYDNDTLIDAFVITCSPEINRQRLIERGKKDDQYKIENWEDYKKQCKLGEDKEHNHFVKGVINNNDFDTTINTIIALTKGKSSL